MAAVCLLVAKKKFITDQLYRSFDFEDSECEQRKKQKANKALIFFFIRFISLCIHILVELCYIHGSKTKRQATKKTDLERSVGRKQLQ